MPVIKRFEMGNGFTHIENDCLRDITLDIQERGLLVTMLSLPDGWDFSGLGLASILPCGKSKVYSTLKKLEKAGYLRRTRITNKKGVVIDWRYDISGSPIFRENQEMNKEIIPVAEDQKIGKITSYRKSESGDKSPVTENRKVEINPLTDFPDVDNPDVDNRKDNQILNNKLLNNINQSINQDNINNININTYRCDDLDSIDEIDIKNRIGYEKLKNEFDEKQLDNIVGLMTETFKSEKERIRIAGENLEAQRVKERFAALTDNHIRYVLECIQSQGGNGIRNIRQYILTSLYNAPVTMESYYAARERPDKPDRESEAERSYDLNEMKMFVNNFPDISP